MFLEKIIGGQGQRQSQTLIRSLIQKILKMNKWSVKNMDKLEEVLKPSSQTLIQNLSEKYQSKPFLEKKTTWLMLWLSQPPLYNHVKDLFMTYAKWRFFLDLLT